MNNTTKKSSQSSRKPIPKFIISIDDDSNRQIVTPQPCAHSNHSPGKDWDLYKENIQPLHQGRKIEALLSSLPLIEHKEKRLVLLEARREKFRALLEEQKDDFEKQLDVWCEHIDWLEQNVPDGGKVSELTTVIEGCIEIYYNKKEFKQDKRLFDVFMKFKRFCDEPVEVFGFMYANSICTLVARFYLNWSWQYEIKRNMQRAEQLIKLGLKNLASPRDVLEEALTQLKCRITRMVRAGELEDQPEGASGLMNAREVQSQLEGGGIRAALQTLKFRVTKKTGVSRVPINRTGASVEKSNIGGLKGQTKIVNGVQVAKTRVGSAPTRSNIPIEIFKDQSQHCQEALHELREEEDVIQHRQQTTDERGLASAGDENDEPMVPKIPTTQKIQTLGKIGIENRVVSNIKLGRHHI